MMKFLKALVSIAIGVVLAHIGHYLYFIHITEKTDTGIPARFAMAVDASLPALKALIHALIISIPWILSLSVIGAGVILFLRYKENMIISDKLRNAEDVYREAEKELHLYRTLVKKCQEDYARKEKILSVRNAKLEKKLKEDFEKNKAPYTEEIKRLKQEKVELRESVAKLMSALKQK